jgi:CBS domain containing-hemolysin-like protein
VAALLIAGFVLVDVLPRTVALRSLDRVVISSASVVTHLSTFAPLRWLADVLVSTAEHLLPRSLRTSAPTVSEKELMAVADRALASEAIDAEEHELIESVIAFGDRLVREVMVPRPDMGCIGSDLTVAGAMAEVARNGHSRTPVSGTGIDDIVGVVHAKDLMRAHLDGRDEEPIGSLARSPRFVPETKQADDLLREMQAGRFHLAIVVDEYGGTAGLVTMEDLLEEVVGEIVDEFDEEEPLSQPVAGGGIRVHGRMPIDELDELLGGSLPVGDWDTVGGLIFDALGHVPVVGEAVVVAGRRFGVEQVVGRRITRVRIGAPEVETGTPT